MATTSLFQQLQLFQRIRQYISMGGRVRPYATQQLFQLLQLPPRMHQPPPLLKERGLELSNSNQQAVSLGLHLQDPCFQGAVLRLRCSDVAATLRQQQPEPPPFCD
eukprot:8798562-Prorocentrum_lima.AAC.1